MVVLKAKYFLLVCCCTLLLYMAIYSRQGTIVQKIMPNILERFKLRTILTSSTTEKWSQNIFTNVSQAIVTQASDSGLYILTAFKRPTTNRSAIFINGWEDKQLKKAKNRYCCFLLSNGSIIYETVRTTVIFRYQPKLEAVMFDCDVHAAISETKKFAVSVSVIEQKLQMKKALPGPTKNKSSAPKPNNILVPKSKNNSVPKQKNVSVPKQKNASTPKQNTSKAQNPKPVAALVEKQLPEQFKQPNSVPNGKFILAQNVSDLNRKLLNVNSTGKTINQGNDLNMTEISNPAKTICPTKSSAYVFPLEPIRLPDTEPATPTIGPIDTDDSLREEANKSIKEKKFSFAICAKIIYGNAEVELVIEWMEYYRRLGTSKVLIFTYNVSAEATKVIRHYEESGFLEVRPFDFPQKDSPKREVGQKNAQAWSDEQVLVYYCYDRLVNYKYVGIIDLDEFILPHKDKNFEELFERLQNTFKNASNFMFPHMVHVLEWNKTSNDNIIVGRYLNHTMSLGYNLKTVYIPDRVKPGGVFTHAVTEPLPGYKPAHVGNVAQLSHYRKRCRPEWVKSNKCFKLKKVCTTRMLELLDNDLRWHIESKKKLLLNKT